MYNKTWLELFEENEKLEKQKKDLMELAIDLQKIIEDNHKKFLKMNCNEFLGWKQKHIKIKEAFDI